MMKSNTEESVDWEKVHSNENEFLEIDVSLESSMVSEEFEESNIGEAIEYDRPVQMKSFSMSIDQLNQGKGISDLFELSQVKENSDFSEEDLIDKKENENFTKSN